MPRRNGRMIRQKTAGAAQPRRCCGRPGWLRPCAMTNLCRGRRLHRPGGLLVMQTPVGADSISARFAAVGAVLASLVKGRWPSEARTEGLFRLEMPLTEGGARFGRAPGAAVCREAIPRSPLSPPLTRGLIGAYFRRGAKILARACRWFVGEGHGPPRGCLRRREGCGRDESRPYKPPKRPAKPDGCNHPVDRRAGCPHPAGACGGANARGGINPAPYEQILCFGPTGWPRPCVMTNLCRGRCSHRPANLAAAGTFAGGYGILPYERGRALRAAGMAAANRTTVGRGALTPPGPAAVQTFAGGINPAPTNGGGVRSQPPPFPCLCTAPSLFSNFP